MIRAIALSNIGNSRENHEDNYLLGGHYLSAEQIESMGINRETIYDELNIEGDYCVAISDGMGGYECGEEASLQTVKYISNHYDELLNLVKQDYHNLKGFVTRLNNNFCQVAKANVETRAMGATLCCIVSVENHMYGFNVGDSRIYRYCDGILEQVSVDHTEGQRLFDLGLLTKDEVESFPKRKAIYKYIGKDIELIPDVFDMGMKQENTIYMMCSDGLSDVLDLNDIQDMLSKQHISTRDKAKFLVDMAVEQYQGCGDNITLMMIEV